MTTAERRRPADGTHRRRFLDISFRLRLLLALVGSVGLLGMAGLLVIRTQTTRQVEWTVGRTADAARRALDELERFRRAELERVAIRVAGSIRIVAALDAAVQGGGVDEFGDQVRYELQLAELRDGVVAFDDRDGRPVLTLIDGQRAPDARAEDGLARQAMAGDGTVVSGYQVIGARLFAVQIRRLELFGEAVGTLTVGFAVDESVASSLSTILGSDVCFAVGEVCLAGTGGFRDAAVAAAASRALRTNQPQFISAGDRRLALVVTALPGAGRIAGVVAAPLDEVLQPFDRILQVQWLAAAAALVLAGVLGTVLSRQLAGPIRTLVGATERVRRGHFDFTVEVPHRDEIGVLATAFNHMTEGLLLKERYRGVLDKVVSPHVAEELMKGEIRLGGETRQVTTLFADVRGFTALTEHLAPEQVITMLNEWLELAAQAIEDEGGVVDKYVGDQVMAIFGAPVNQDDHAACGVRAALRLRDLTAGLSQRRVQRGEAALQVGVGVNTGPAVAGNMGSSRRLNYTVLGASVNAAARLCSAAGAGAVLVSEETMGACDGQFETTPQEPRVFKGFSGPMTPYLVHRMRGVAGTLGPTLALALGCLGLATCTVRAQTVDVPTLAELGGQYVSADGSIQLRPSLRVDLDGYWPQDTPAWHLPETSPFAAGRASLFVDLFAGRRVVASTELRVDRGQPARAGGLEAHVQQAFVRVIPRPGTNVSIQVGKAVSPFGNYPSRAHTAADPFIRPPLAYDHRTVMSASTVPATRDGVFTWKDRPEFRAAGLPIVWAVPYPIGVTVAGGSGHWGWAGALVNSAPSAEPGDWNRLSFQGSAGPSVVGRVTFQASPEVQIGASYSGGSYVHDSVAGADPALVGGRRQDLAGVDLTWTRGHVEGRAEVLVNRWDVYRLPVGPRDVSYYAEGRVTLLAGLFAALRYNAVHCLELPDSSGELRAWDYDMRRVQVGWGYRLGRGTEVRAEYLFNRTIGRPDPSDNLWSVQWWWAF